MAINRGRTAVINNFAGMWLSPLMAQLSDSIGRKRLMMMGRAGTVVFFATLPHHKRMWTRMLIECLAWGVVGAGHWPMFAAARSDLFGEKPDLMARIELTDQTFANVSGFVGQLAGVAVSARFGHFVAMYVTAGLAAFSIFLIGLQRETLPPEKRKPFTLRGVLQKGNPLSNLHLLLGHGPGLRKLTMAVTLFFCYNSSLQFGPSYRFGPMMMTPQDSSLFDAAKMPVAALSSGALVTPFVKAVGSKRAFEIGSVVGGLTVLGSAFAWVTSGQFGAPRTQRFIQLGVCELLLVTVPVACATSLRSMVVKQGIEVTTAGRGEINAAFAGLGQITGVFMPLFWSNCFAWFANTRALKGGFLIVAASAWLAAYGVSRSLSPSELMLEERKRED